MTIIFKGTGGLGNYIQCLVLVFIIIVNMNCFFLEDVLRVVLSTLCCIEGNVSYFMSFQNITDCIYCF